MPTPPLIPDFSQTTGPTPVASLHPYVAAALFLAQHLRALDREHPDGPAIRRAIALLSADVVTASTDAGAVRLARRIQAWLERQVS